jgi:hypothetical protein
VAETKIITIETPITERRVVHMNEEHKPNINSIEIFKVEMENWQGRFSIFIFMQANHNGCSIELQNDERIATQLKPNRIR